MFPKLKRRLIMPFVRRKRRQFLWHSIMTPEEILSKEAEYHDLMIVANRKGISEREKEYMYKRDVLREILRING